MYYEKITDNKKITPGEYRVYQGDFVGTWLCQSKDKKNCYLTDGKIYLEFCQKNVAIFKVIKGYSCYYFRAAGFLCGIKWRDGRESFIMLPDAGVKMIEKALKRNVYPKY